MPDGPGVWSANQSYRRHRTGQWLARLTTGWDRDPWRSRAAALAALEDFQRPRFPVTVQPCVDAVATVLVDQRARRRVAFMDYNPYSSSSPVGRVGGVGKSFAAFRMVGLERITAPQGAAALIADVRPSPLRLVASDMGFFSAERGLLTFNPAVGEPGLCAWDLVRLVARLDGDERDEQKLRLLGHMPQWCPAALVQSVLASVRTPCRITDVIAFEETGAMPSPPEVPLTPVDHPADRRAVLHNCLCNGLRQPSGNWRRPAEPHGRAAGSIVEELRHLPRVWVLHRYADPAAPEGSAHARVSQLARILMPRQAQRCLS